MLFCTRALFGLLVMLFALAAQAENAATENYVFGIPPVQSTVELAKRWTPLVQYLSEKTGIRLRFQTAKDLETYQQQIRDGYYDIAFMHPLYYLTFHKLVGYNAFADEKDGECTGLILVKKESPINEVEQLNGETLAFPSANAASATVGPTRFLKSKGITVNPKYVNSLDSVYRTVAKGLFVAGGGESRTLAAMDPEVRNQLRVLWQSVPTPSFLFVAHPRVPNATVEKIQRAMNEMDITPQGRALLKSINFKAIEKTEDKDYDDYRKLVAKSALHK